MQPGIAKLPHLFQPGRFGRFPIKNRIKYGACCVSNYNTRDGFITEREIARNTVLELGYVGSRGVKLFMNTDLNQQRIYGDFLNAFKELQAFQTNASAPISAGNTLVRLFGTLEVPRISSHAPRITASSPTPTMVVLEPGRIRTRACCAAADALRASSSGPFGALRPHVAGSNAATNASSE